MNGMYYLVLITVMIIFASIVIVKIQSQIIESFLLALSLPFLLEMVKILKISRKIHKI
ncbi:hypothetical protein [Saccharolobus sp. A20]|uniref:hypothetical protein n=1 Tax=Saccharolobus sp. A20 TaxID=1891280 RepID=UPI0012EA112E|nr:hypothetical protein [Sulfolobus sp. A20]